MIIAETDPCAGMHSGQAYRSASWRSASYASDTVTRTRQRTSGRDEAEGKLPLRRKRDTA